MARSFNNSTPDRLSTTTIPVTAYPFTWACWIYLDNLTTAQVAIGMDFDGSHYHWLIVGTGGNVFAATKAVTYAEGSTTATLSAGGWYHIAGVWASATSRTPYLSGAAGTANTTNLTPTTPTTMYIGALGTSFSADADIAEVGVWSATLTTAEIAVLATGASPVMVRPGNLLSYWPLFGKHSPEPDRVGGIGMSLTGSPATAPHPRVFWPTFDQIARPAAAAPGGRTTRNRNTYFPGMFHGMRLRQAWRV